MSYLTNINLVFLERNLSKFILSIILFSPLIVSGISHAQNLDQLEQKYNLLQYSFQKEDSVLNSLRWNMNERVKQIDYEKKKKDPDKNKITTMMAHSATLANQIDLQQKKVSQSFKDLENVKKSLSLRYSKIIDSLKVLKNSREKEISESDLDTQILLFTGKKLITIPRISGISFNPEKILNIDFNSFTDMDEKELYLEYLKNAIRETDLQLMNVNEACNETEQIVRLNKKMKKFLDEAEFDVGIKPINKFSKDNRNNNSYSNNHGGVSVGNGDTKVSNDANTAAQIMSYANLLKQLKPQQSSGILFNLRSLLDSSSNRFSVSEYYNLLKELKQSLEEYRNTLSAKLNKIK